MNKAGFIGALRSLLKDLPADQIQEICADYEEYFRDGEARGRSEEEIARGLGDPAKIAKELRAETRLQEWQKKKSFGNLGRVVVGLAALGSLNLFLAIPSLVVMLLLSVSYIASVSMIIVGLVAAASYLPGVNNAIHFEADHDKGHSLHIINEKEGKKVEITRDGKSGTHIHVEDKNGTRDIVTTNDDDDGEDDEDGRPAVTLKAENDGVLLLGGGLGLPDEIARAVAAVCGLGGGILWLLVNLWITRLVVCGFIRYARLNYSILRGK